MTVIIGHIDGWMVADTLMLHGNDRHTACKILKFDNCLIGVSGLSVVKQLLRKKIGDKDPLEGTAEYLQEHNMECDVIHVGNNKNVTLITGNGTIIVPKGKYWVIGSGMDLVLGYLAGRKKGGLVEPNDAVEAIKFAAAMNNSVNAQTTMDTVQLHPAVLPT